MADYCSQSLQPNDATVNEAQADDTPFNVHRTRALHIHTHYSVLRENENGSELFRDPQAAKSKYFGLVAAIIWRREKNTCQETKCKHLMKT